jgi:hypothetical protein
MTIEGNHSRGTGRSDSSHPVDRISEAVTDPDVARYLVYGKRGLEYMSPDIYSAYVNCQHDDNARCEHWKAAWEADRALPDEFPTLAADLTLAEKAKPLLSEARQALVWAHQQNHHDADDERCDAARDLIAAIEEALRE